jgi:hypothetical protein
MVYRFKDALGLSPRVPGGLYILFAIVDLNLEGAVGQRATEQARQFLTEFKEPCCGGQPCDAVRA